MEEPLVPSNNATSLKVPWLVLLGFLIALFVVVSSYQFTLIRDLDAKKADEKMVQSEHTQFRKALEELSARQQRTLDLLLEKLGPPGSDRARREGR